MPLIRRTFLSLLGSAALGTSASAAQRKSLSEPMRLGVAQPLADGGLATRLQVAFIGQTGLVIELIPNPCDQVLAALERGELHMALTNAPQQETTLVNKGLAHLRTEVARAELVLVGPKSSSERKAVTKGHETDVIAALRAIAQTPVRFVSAPQGSGAHELEQALWHTAEITPAAPWHSTTPSGTDALALAASTGAVTLLERGLWLAQPHPPIELNVWVQGDERMRAPVHLTQSFRAHHPAAQLFTSWVRGPKGQRVVRTHPGWLPPT